MRSAVLQVSLCLFVLHVAIGASAQTTPGTVGPGARRLEVEIIASDGGLFVSSADGGVGLGSQAQELRPPQLLRDSKVLYPAALAAGEVVPSGEVHLELLIDGAGRVQSTKVIKGLHPLLDAEASRASLGLVFEPATLGGSPTSVRLPFVYRFVAPPTKQRTAVLRGQVRQRGTRRPLAGAVIQVEGVVVETDAAGRFEIVLSPGEHTVRLSAPGHRPAKLQETLLASQEVGVRYVLEAVTVSPYETIVRGERPREEVSRITLRGQELREVPGTMGDPFRVVMLMPGVGTLASGIAYPVVRGSQPAATGYFLDGVRVPALFHALLGPAVVHPDFIEGMDFYPGLPPVRFGRLMSGAIEGHVAKPRDDRLRATAYADFINAGGFVEHPFKDSGTSLTLAGRISYTPLLIGLLATDNSGGYTRRPIAEFYDYQGRVEQRVLDGRLRLLAFGASDVIGMSSTDPADVSGFATQTFHRVDLRYAGPALGGDVGVNATWGRDVIGIRGEQGGELIGDYGLWQTLGSVRASFGRALGDFARVELGADLEHRRATNSLLVGSAVQQQYDGDSGAALRAPKSIVTMASVHAQLVWRPDDRWTVLPGLRFDNYHLLPAISHQVLEPRLVVRRTLTPTVLLKGGVGLVHQPPTVLVNLPVLDAAGLRYGLQEGAQVDVGAELRPSPALEVTIDAYLTRLFRAVEFDIAKVFSGQRSAGSIGVDPGTPGRAFGAELMVRHPLGQNWFGWLSYAYQRSERLRSFVRRVDERQVTATRGWVPFAFEQQPGSSTRHTTQS